MEIKLIKQDLSSKPGSDPLGVFEFLYTVAKKTVIY